MKNTIKDFVTSSFFLYLVAGIVLVLSVDFPLMARQRIKYVRMKYWQSAGQDLRNGVLAFEGNLRMNPHDAISWASLGYCYFGLGEYDKAVAAYQKAVALRPDFEKFQKDLESVLKVIN